MRLAGALLLLFVPLSAHAQGVFRGPYLNDVTSDEVSVLWESPQPTTGVVRYGAGTPNARTAQSATPAKHHEVRLTGLSALAAPGSTFRYELEVGGTVYPGSFRTMPAAGAPFSFIVYGDNRSSPMQHQVVIGALLREMPAAWFAINTGDLVSSGQSESDWDAFFPVAAPFLASMPLYVAIGNHEVDLGRWTVTQRIFRMPTAVPPASNNEGFFHVVYGNVELIVINVESDSLYTLSFLAGDQEDWLERALAMRPAGVQHRFVFIHQGPYSSKTGRNGNFWLRQWLDRFAAAGVDVIFSGHDHYGERGWTKNGLYYVIHGGGGAPLYATLGPRTVSDHTIVYGESRLGYVRVDVDGPKAHVIMKGIAGEVVDEFSYGDGAAPLCRQASDCGPAPRYGCPMGAWSCVNSGCRYSCPGDTPLIACATDRACATSIGASCPNGTPTCEHPSIDPRSWYCRCVLPPECQAAGDCAGRPSPIADCTGTWGCVDDQCEFTATMCMPADAGVRDSGVSADGGTSADAGTSPRDGGPIADAANPPADASPIAADATPPAADATQPAVDATQPAADATRPAADATPLAADAGAAAPTDAGTAPPPSSGCGCNAAAARASEAGPAWLLLALALRGSASRRRRPSPSTPRRG